MTIIILITRGNNTDKCDNNDNNDKDLQDKDK